MSALVPVLFQGTLLADATATVAAPTVHQLGQVPRRLTIRFNLANYTGTATWQPVLDGSNDGGATFDQGIFLGTAQAAAGTFMERVPEDRLVYTAYRVRSVKAGGLPADDVDLNVQHLAVIEA